MERRKRGGARDRGDQGTSGAGQQLEREVRAYDRRQVGKLTVGLAAAFWGLRESVMGADGLWDVKQQAEQMRRNPAVPEPTRREARKQQQAARGKDIKQIADGAIIATAGVGAMYDAVQDTKAVGKIAQAQREAIAEAGASGNSPDARDHRPDPPPDGRVNGGEGTASPGGR